VTYDPRKERENNEIEVQRLSSIEKARRRNNSLFVFLISERERFLRFKSLIRKEIVSFSRKRGSKGEEMSSFLKS
jgi:hypothetical protein